MQYINKTLEKSLRKDVARRGKLSKEEVRKMYKEAYENFPLQPDEFEIEDEQMEEVWKQV